MSPCTCMLVLFSAMPGCVCVRECVCAQACVCVCVCTSMRACVCMHAHLEGGMHAVWVSMCVCVVAKGANGLFPTTGFRSEDGIVSWLPPVELFLTLAELGKISNSPVAKQKPFVVREVKTDGGGVCVCVCVSTPTLCLEAEFSCHCNLMALLTTCFWNVLLYM